METDKFNIYAYFIIVELSFTSKKFVESLTEEFPELASGFKSLASLPGDESQTHLESLFQHNEDKLKTFLNQYLKDNESDFNWTTFLDKYEVTPVAGRFFKIDKTEDAYMEFVSQMRDNRWVFSHMSVTSDENNYTIFFA